MPIQPFSEEEILFAGNRAVANSVDTELSKLEKEMGWDKPVVVPTNIPHEKGAAQASQEETNTPGFFAKAGAIVSSIAGSAKKGIQAAGDKPEQAAAGVADVGSQITQAFIDVGNSFWNWAKRSGFDNTMMDDSASVDLGSYVAPKPQTETEKLARGTGKFVGEFTAFAGAALATGGAAAVSGAGALATAGASAIGAGAAGFAAFDPHEERISNFLNNYPQTRNIVTEYLAAKPGDSTMEGRFKGALENIIGDVALAGAFAGAMKSYKIFRGSIKQGAESTLEAGAKTGADAVAAAEATAKTAETGTESINIKAAQEVPGNVQAAEKTSKLPEIPPGELNNADVVTQAEADKIVSQMTGKEPPVAPAPGSGKGLPASERAVRGMKDLSVEDLTAPLKPEEMEAVAKEFNIGKFDMEDSPIYQEAVSNGGFKDAKGGVISDEQIFKEAAKTAAENPEKLLAWKPGMPVSREMPLAAQMRFRPAAQAWAEKRSALIALASQKQAGVQISESVMNVARAEYQQARTAAVGWYGVIQGTGGDVARSLRVMRFADKSIDSVFETAILNADRVKMSGGADAIEKMAQMEAKISADPDFVKHAKVLAEDASKGSWADSAYRLYLDVILSNPATHIGNTVSNTVQLATRGLDRFFGASYSLVSKIAGSKQFPEAMITDKLAGEIFPGKILGDLTSAEKNILNVEATKRAAYDAQRITFEETGAYLKGIWNGLWEDAAQFRFLVKEEGAVLQTSEKYGAGIRKLDADQFESMSNMEKALHFMSHFKRPTDALGAMDGFMGAVATRAEQRALSWRYAEAVSSTKEQMQQVFEQTMREPPAFIREQVLKARKDILLNGDIQNNVLGKAVKKSIEAIHSFPGGKVIVPFTTVASNMTDQALQRTGVFSALSPNFRQAFSAGGAARDMAIGKVATGLTAMAPVAYMVLQGEATGTGPINPDANKLWQGDGKQPYSVKVGDKWIKMDNLGPLGLAMKTAANLTAIAAYVPEAKKEDYEDLMLSTTALVMDAVTPDFLFDQTGKFLDFVKNPTKESSKKYLAQVLSGPIQPGLGRSMTRGETGPIGGAFFGALGGSNFGAAGAVAGAVAGAAAGYQGQKQTSEGTAVKRSTQGETPWGDTQWSIINGVINNFISTIPGLSANLPPQRNLFGEVVHYPEGHGPEVSSPIAFGNSGKSVAVEQELIRLGLAGPLYKPDAVDPNDEHLMARLPPKTISLGGARIELTNEQYESFQLLATGQLEPLVKAKLIDKSTAKEFQKMGTLRAQLETMIALPEWKKLPDSFKKQQINEKIMGLRKMVVGTKENPGYLFAAHPELNINLMQGRIERMGNLSGMEKSEIQQQKNQIENTIKKTTKGEPQL